MQRSNSAIALNRPEHAERVVKIDRGKKVGEMERSPHPGAPEAVRVALVLLNEAPCCTNHRDTKAIHHLRYSSALIK